MSCNVEITIEELRCEEKLTLEAETTAEEITLVVEDSACASGGVSIDPDPTNALEAREFGLYVEQNSWTNKTW